jgi:hypothetical protein
MYSLKEKGPTMSCPYLKEVVMLYCQAYPVKKLIPLDRIASAEPCLGTEFESCPLFTDVLAKMRAHSRPESPAIPLSVIQKEVFR